MDRNILLVEPAYRSKYPPLGLMKISSYHKMMGDNVRFVKGCDLRVLDEYWDRVYITTLFTYTWNETVKTIKFYHKGLYHFGKKIFVGGILASLMPKELFDATGIEPIEGLLDNSAKIGFDDNVNIDDLIPDYDILNQVDFEYSNTNAYIGYSTRGCPNDCEFCAVNTFEPEYIPYVDIKNIVNGINEKHGEKQNLLLMDNNVLCSKKFNQIIDDIKASGFDKISKFGPTRKKKIVDFNQGLDARNMTEAKVRKLSEIPLEPIRIAFDDIKFEAQYVKAVRLANKYGFKNMSNYILYNFMDTPEDFYERLRINIALNEEFKEEHEKNGAVKSVIYSFPMRFIPLDAKSRSEDTNNPFWNKRYLRGVQVILSVLRGPVMTGKQFFEQAFGRNSEEFKSILMLPDEFIRNRLVEDWQSQKVYEDRLAPYVSEFFETYRSLPLEQRIKTESILIHNNKDLILDELREVKNEKIKFLLRSYLRDKEVVDEYKNGKTKAEIR